MNSVLVLMSTYNGEKYLNTQLDSLVKQKDVDIHILIRDDGSSDRTIDIIKEYKDKYDFIDYYLGKNLGYAKSFWDLVKNASSYDYYAYSDQDDIWDEYKLSKAIDKLGEDEAMLYTSRVKSVDNNLNTIDEDTFKNHKVLSIYESLKKSTVPGCVMVFNHKAILKMKKYNGYLESHDWLTYAIITLFGKVVFDENSYINYRIHNNNTIGKSNAFKEFYKKIKRFFKKSINSRSKLAYDLYQTYKEEIMDNEIKEYIHSFGTYKNSLKDKIKFLFNKHNRGIIFKLYIILNRI